MNFFRGIAGLFLYIGTLMSPVGESRINVRSIEFDEQNNCRVQSVFEFRWDDDLTALVNSGIPIIVKFTMRLERETDEFYRILSSPVSRRYYFVSDSAANGEVSSQRFANIPLALRHFQRVVWEFDPQGARFADFGAEIQNSFVASMEVYVDISSAFGGRMFSQRVRIEERSENETAE